MLLPTGGDLIDLIIPRTILLTHSSLPTDLMTLSATSILLVWELDIFLPTKLDIIDDYIATYALQGVSRENTTQD